ncbi:MAG TPA: cation-transporting P-type ATPase [Marmoricola sp.]|nr:cation-transporting P-type ATPase [Marmoricola sp.]
MEQRTTSTPVAPRGLTSLEARERLAQDGPNVMPRVKQRSLVREFVRQLTHLLALLLWVAVVLALLAGMPALAVAIAVIVVLNAAFAFWQEYRADRSAERLRRLLPTATRVLRDGVPVTVDAADLVVGDVVLLSAGDRVAADLEVHVAHELGCDESMVTGESGTVPRSTGNRLMAGTFVVQGEGEATVAATGANTTLAGISALAQSASRTASPLSVQLARVVRVVAVIAATTGILLGLGALGLGLSATEAFLFGIGVSVALVPEGLLPTVTLSLARGAQLMADRNALVRRLDAVETLGATTFVCTDKTGTLTQNRMSVREVATPYGGITVSGTGYQPEGTVVGSDAAIEAARQLARAALACVTGRAVRRGDDWVAEGDPMEAALHTLARRLRVSDEHSRTARRRPYTSDRLMSSCREGEEVFVIGAPERVFDRCVSVPSSAHAELAAMVAAGRRVLAVATRTWQDGRPSADWESALSYVGLVALEDPPREDVTEALEACRRADIKVAMITGDHPRTAEAIGREVGLLRPGGLVVEGTGLPADDGELARLLEHEDGVVVARVTPADKFRIARVLHERGHVVAMTGDGVNDAPALREADVGVAMGASGSDVAREAADVVLLDDHFGTIVAAIELGRATFQNVRRFLTYHLTDNIAELTPFVLWALTAGRFPLAIGVLQVLALDIGTDMLPALALGAEPANPRVMAGRRADAVVDRALLVRAFGILGATEALVSMVAFTVVLHTGGWTWGSDPSDRLLALASGTAFAAISVGQMANAFACRSSSRPVWRLQLGSNRLVLAAVGAEVMLLAVFLGLPPVREQLGGSWPSGTGWALAVTAGVAVVAVDGLVKVWRVRHRQESDRAGRVRLPRD